MSDPDYTKDWQALAFLLIATPIYVFCNFRRRRRHKIDEPTWRHPFFLQTEERSVENFTAPYLKRQPPPNPPRVVASGFRETKFSVKSLTHKASVIFNLNFIFGACLLSMCCSWWLRISPEIGIEFEQAVFFSEPSMFANMGALWRALESILILGTFPFGLYMYHCLERFRHLAALMHAHRQRLCSLALLLGEALPECLPPVEEDELKRVAGIALAEEILQAKWTLYRFLNVAHYCSYASMSKRFRQPGFASNLVRAGLLLETEAKFIEVYSAHTRNIADVAYRWICQLVIALVRAEATELQAIQSILQALTSLKDAYTELADEIAYKPPEGFSSMLALTVNMIIFLTPASLAYAFSTAHGGVSTYLVPAMGSMLVAGLFKGALEVVQALQHPFESKFYDLDPDWTLMATERALFEILACHSSELFKGGSGVVPAPPAPPPPVFDPSAPVEVEEPASPKEGLHGEAGSVVEFSMEAEASEDSRQPGSPSHVLKTPSASSPFHSSKSSPHSPGGPRMRRASGDGTALQIPENIRRFSLEVTSMQVPEEDEDDSDDDDSDLESSLSSSQVSRSTRTATSASGLSPRGPSSRASRALSVTSAAAASASAAASVAPSVPDDDGEAPVAHIRTDVAEGLRSHERYKGPFFGPGVEPEDVDGLLKELQQWAAPRGPVMLSDETLQRISDILQRQFAKIEQLLSVYNFLPDGAEDGEDSKSAAWGEDERLVADLLMRLHEASRGTTQIRHTLGVAGVGDPGRIAFDALFPDSSPPQQPPTSLEERRRMMVAKAEAELRAEAARARADQVAAAVATKVAARQQHLQERRQQMQQPEASAHAHPQRPQLPAAATPGETPSLSPVEEGAGVEGSPSGFPGPPPRSEEGDAQMLSQETVTSTLPLPYGLHDSGEQSEGLPGAGAARARRRRPAGASQAPVPEVK